jgi:hypothetical protein
MMTIPLTIHVEPDTAQAFLAASEEDRRKMELLLSLQLGRLVAPPSCSLEEAMDRLGREAEANGMTPEILESILANRDE